MEHAIHAFLDGVLVNADDLPTRVNRLQLLSEVRELFVRGWDLSRVVVEGEEGRVRRPVCARATRSCCSWRSRCRPRRAPRAPALRARRVPRVPQGQVRGLARVGERPLHREEDAAQPHGAPGLRELAADRLLLRNEPGAVPSRIRRSILKEQNIDMRCVVNQGRHAAPDPKRRMFVNYELFYLSTHDALERFKRHTLQYCGWLTDPVSGARFRPTSASPRWSTTGAPTTSRPSRTG
jgi:hypothetical protein